jgi:bacterioferritin-associated ferredoxin
MYICLCNGITDRDVHRVAAGGDGTVAQIYRGLGCTPQCGKCVPVVREMVAQLPGQSAADNAA